MSSFAELQILKAEERTLVVVLSKIQDQLNRLKVEEMALMSQIRDADEGDGEEMVQSEQESEADAGEVIEAMPELDLELKLPCGKSDEVMEEEEDEEEGEEDSEDGDHDQLTAFLKQLKKAKLGL